MEKDKIIDGKSFIEMAQLIKRSRSEESAKKVAAILKMTIPEMEKRTLIEQNDREYRDADVRARFMKLLNGGLDPRIKMNAAAMEHEINSRLENFKKDPNHFCILLVDDLTYITQTVSHNLKKDGFQVVIAKNSTEAIFLFHKTLPDLVITDVRLPDFNGIVLSKILRKLDDNIPIIFVTAIDFEVDQNIDIDSDLVDEIKHNDLTKSRMAYLRKPILKEVLLEKMESLLGRSGSSTGISTTPKQ